MSRTYEELFRGFFYRIIVWTGGVVARSGNNLGQVVHTRASVTKQYNLVPVEAVMPCGWEGNRRSGVTLAMRHRLQWFIHLRAHGLDREMSTYALLCSMAHLPLPY